MKLIFLRGDCDDGRTCPNVNLTDRNTYVVQGYDVVDPSISPHESVVEISLSLVPELAGNIDVHHTDRATVLIRGTTVHDPEALAELALQSGSPRSRSP